MGGGFSEFTFVARDDLSMSFGEWEAFDFYGSCEERKERWRSSGGKGFFSARVGPLDRELGNIY